MCVCIFSILHITAQLGRHSNWRRNEKPRRRETKLLITECAENHPLRFQLQDGIILSTTLTVSILTVCMSLQRVLHMDTSPDGCTIVSAAADETLRFWDMFGPPPNSKKSNRGMEHGVPGSLTTMHNLR